MKRLKIIDEGIIFKSKKNTDRQSCTFPGICILPEGRWISTCRAAPTKNDNSGHHVLISFSDDEGNTWSEPNSPFSTVSFNNKPGTFRTGYITSIDENELIIVLSWVDNSNEELPFFNNKTEGLLDCKIFISRSFDNGLTWSQPVLVKSPVFQNVPTPTTGPILNLSDNTLACQFEVNKSYFDTNEWRHSSVLIFSDDKGFSWNRYVITSSDPKNRIFYWDQRPGIVATKHILDLFWTYDRLNAKYLNIHAKESLDNGITWSPVWDTKLPGQPSNPVALSDGRIVIFFVDRTKTPVIKCRISNDKGKSWPAISETTIYSSKKIETQTKNSLKDAWKEMEDFSIGLPSAAILPDDNIIVVYYAGENTNNTDIRWARLSL